MSWATEDDEHIRLLRAVKRHHLNEADGAFPGLNAFRYELRRRSVSCNSPHPTGGFISRPPE